MCMADSALGTPRRISDSGTRRRDMVATRHCRRYVGFLALAIWQNCILQAAAVPYSINVCV